MHQSHKRSPIILTLLLLGLCAGMPSYRASYYDTQCTDAYTGRTLFVGEAFSRNCIRYQCLVNGKMWEDHCQQPKLQGQCQVVPPANEHLDYPSCCPMFECQTYETNENGETLEKRIYDHYGNLRKTDIRQVLVINERRGNGLLSGNGLKTQFDI